MDARLLQILGNREQNYPHALEQQYPRVFGKLMELWDSTDIDAYFIDLLVSDRPDRQGFPPDVASDIVYLSMIHARQRGRDEVDPWGHVSEEVRNGIELQDLPFSPEGFLKAAESGKREAVALFLSAGVDVDTCDERQWTPLMISAFNGNEEMAALLIKSGADIHHKDTAGYTPLHWAAFNGFTQVVQLLLSKHADVNARSQHGWTALLQAATRGHLSVSYILIEHGADVNAASNDGWTPLHKAAANGHFPEVKLLLSKGADTRAKYANGVTPLDLATKNKHEQIVAVLSGWH
ncbi:MAG: ankyrin repeat domain-containing protein [Nitrosomonadales bacterium]|nr:ankyrin repeat domain-containing protein [Nitrosomonadales bacterium]